MFYKKFHTERLNLNNIIINAGQMKKSLEQQNRSQNLVSELTYIQDALNLNLKRNSSQKYKQLMEENHKNYMKQYNDYVKNSQHRNGITYGKRFLDDYLRNDSDRSELDVNLSRTKYLKTDSKKSSKCDLTDNKENVYKIGRKQRQKRRRAILDEYRKHHVEKSDSRVFHGHTVSAASTDSNEQECNYVINQVKLEEDDSVVLAKQKQRRHRTIFTRKHYRSLSRNQPTTITTENSQQNGIDMKKTRSDSNVMYTPVVKASEENVTVHNPLNDEQIEKERKRQLLSGSGGGCGTKERHFTRRQYTQKMREMKQMEVQTLAKKLMDTKQSIVSEFHKIMHDMYEERYHRKLSGRDKKKSTNFETAVIANYEQNMDKLKKLFLKLKYDGPIVNNELKQIFVNKNGDKRSSSIDLQKMKSEQCLSKHKRDSSVIKRNKSIKHSQSLENINNNSIVTKPSRSRPSTERSSAKRGGGKARTVRIKTSTIAISDSKSLIKDDTVKKELTDTNVVTKLTRSVDYHGSLNDSTIWTDTVNIKCSSILQNENSASGFILIEAMKMKRLSEPLENNIYFILHHGNIVVTIGTNTFEVKSLDHFYVPIGVSYSIKNVSYEKALLSYIKIKHFRK